MYLIYPSIHITCFHFTSVFDLARVFARTQLNAHELINCLTLESIGCGIMPSVSIFNHSCRPNAEYHLLPPASHSETDETHVVVSATRAVQKGEELFVTYTDLYQTRSRRQQILKESFSFSCECERCTERPSRRGNETTDVPDQRMCSWLCPQCSSTISSVEEFWNGTITINDVAPTILSGDYKPKGVICNKCNQRRNETEFVIRELMIVEATDRACTLFDEAKQNEALTAISETVKIAEQYLHPHHYLRYDLCRLKQQCYAELGDISNCIEQLKLRLWSCRSIVFNEEDHYYGCLLASLHYRIAISLRAKSTSTQRQLTNAEKALSTLCSTNNNNNNQKKKKRKRVAKLRKELLEQLTDCASHSKATRDICRVIVGEEHWATLLTTRLHDDVSKLLLTASSETTGECPN
eukprot:TRINITY_DN4685_c0_g2_i1.p1 TRINITY_DN4685_c0_g2~~TRINITY_DN4685_c0_g2_i1.p1  ORF type:complete len:410 (+),score=72.57 TRINITY_DN4685_c0_g2_i1:53-1282(+)